MKRFIITILLGLLMVCSIQAVEPISFSNPNKSTPSQLEFKVVNTDGGNHNGWDHKHHHIPATPEAGDWAMMIGGICSRPALIA